MSDKKPDFSRKKVPDLSNHAGSRVTFSPTPLPLWQAAAFVIAVPIIFVLFLVVMIVLSTVELIGHVTGLYKIDLGSDKHAAKQAPPSEETYNDEIERLLEPANQGEMQAQTELGALFETGYGGVRNYEEALKWYRIAASQGDPYAMLKLGKMFQYGFGVKRDEVQAFMWCELALEFEYMIDAPEDHNLTEEINSVLKMLKRKMTDSEIEEARALVENSFKKSC